MMTSTSPDNAGLRLRRMKAVALAFLAGAAAVFVSSFFVAPDTQVNGFVRAAAEAAMVGGLADWFAVTALFRRPLGLPIPHTALIPRGKDRLAVTLGGFVRDQFLTADVLRERLERAGLVARGGGWLADEANARQLAERLADLAASALDRRREQELADALLRLLRELATEQPLAPHAGKLLRNVLDNDSHRVLVTFLLHEAGNACAANRDDLADKLRRVIEDTGLIGYLAISPGRSRRLIDDAAKELHQAADDPAHVVSRTADDLLRMVSAELISGGGRSAAGLNNAVEDFLVLPETSLWLAQLLGEWLTGVQKDLRHPDGELVGRLAEMLGSFGLRVVEDPQVRTRLETSLEGTVLRLVDEFGEEFTRLIQHVVGGWSGEFASKQIERHVGRDLQFIRINGTVIGALAGLAIHFAAVVLH